MTNCERLLDTADRELQSTSNPLWTPEMRLAHAAASIAASVLAFTIWYTGHRVEED